MISQIHTEAGVQRCSAKMVFLKVLENSQESNCVGVPRQESSRLQADYKETLTQVFPVNFVKVLRTSILNFCKNS